MLRQSFLNKYKEKSKFGEDRFSQEDEGYLLKQYRPIKSNFMSSIKKERINQFIGDVLSNKRLTTVLYATNADLEIQTYNKIKKIFYKRKEEMENKIKSKNEPSSVVKRRNRREVFAKIKNEISNFKIEKEKYKRFLTESNNKRAKKLREEVEKEKKEYFDDLRANFISGYKRAFSRIKYKLGILKLGTKGGFLETEVDYPKAFEFFSQNIKMPKVKLDIRDVYSRLYNNAVILYKDLNNENNKEKFKRRAISTKRGENNKNNEIEDTNKNIVKKFRLKNALLLNHGKEFTIKINHSQFKKCHYKYSGGPGTIKYLKNETEKKNVNEKRSYFVNYYNLVEPNTGNTFLHKAALDNIPEMALYFVEKGANLNIQNKEGNTPLHLALKCKHDKIIKILMDNKAALDLPNSDGEIPFEYFTSEQKREYGIDKIIVLNPTKKK